MKLIIVYNAYSSLISQTFDALHKMISPNTYVCNLCRVSYGNFRMKEEWKKFLRSLEIETVFYHKDEFEKAYPNSEYTTFPIILIQNKSAITQLASATEVNKLENEQQLITLIRNKVQKYKAK